MEQSADFSLPLLLPDLEIRRAPDSDGALFWTIHDPAANAYYKIDWRAFECLSRFSSIRRAAALKEAIEAETTLTVTMAEISELVTFLEKAGLTDGARAIVRQKSAVQPFWKKIFHTYLYFTIPMFRPQAFLNKTYPYISVLFSPVFVRAMLTLLFIMVLYTLPRLDEFFSTFVNLFSAEGIAAILLTFTFVKIIHEFAHAYAATRYGVRVPHMGLAFIVLYPVLYTETTGGWGLSSRRARFHIAVAGIVAELCLSALFLILWHVSTPGSLAQTLSFLVVCVSLAGSLAINLNPLMRFDGYFMLSDLTGIDNLQSRSIAFARWRMRRVLFGLVDAAPEDITKTREKFLTRFGFALLIYRFFLFLGIALLVYHLFFQPLGTVLMMVELSWFILLPIWSELKIWYERRADILVRKQTKVTAACFIFVLLTLIVPWKTTVLLPAMRHAANHRVFYPPAPARLIDIHVQEGTKVVAGDVLAMLESHDLQNRVALARHTLEKLESLKRRQQAMSEIPAADLVSMEIITAARVRYEGLKDQQNRLRIVAPNDGIIRDLNIDLQPGRYITAQEPLFTLLQPEKTVVTAYVSEGTRAEIRKGASAEFLSDALWSRRFPAKISRISESGQAGLDWPQLASLYGGPIPSDAGPDDGRPVPRRALYEVQAALEDGEDANFPLAERGHLRVEIRHSAILPRYIKELMAKLRAEVKL